MAGTIMTVSVIIPVFNGARYIHGAIKSVFDQTFKDFEIIVVDDGSTDDTKAVLEQWINDGKIHYVHQKNKGLAGARNTGIRQAQGQYLKFLDCDDVLYPQQLELQVGHLFNKSELIISVTDFELEFESKVKKKVKIQFGSRSQLGRFIEANPCPVHTILVRRSLVEKMGGFTQELLSQEDTDLWLRILLQGGSFEKIDYTGCCYRILNKSLSADKAGMFNARCKLSERLNQYLLPGLDQLKDEIRDPLLMVNFKYIHICFLRKISPASCLPKTLQVSSLIYAMKPDKSRQFLLKLAGVENIALLQYFKRCLTDHNYRILLDNAETFWREEKNYA